MPATKMDRFLTRGGLRRLPPAMLGRGAYIAENAQEKEALNPRQQTDGLVSVLPLTGAFKSIPRAKFRINA